MVCCFGVFGRACYELMTGVWVLGVHPLLSASSSFEIPILGLDGLGGRLGFRHYVHNAARSALQAL